MVRPSEEAVRKPSAAGVYEYQYGAYGADTTEPSATVSSTASAQVSPASRKPDPRAASRLARISAANVTAGLLLFSLTPPTPAHKASGSGGGITAVVQVRATCASPAMAITCRGASGG